MSFPKKEEDVSDLKELISQWLLKKKDESGPNDKFFFFPFLFCFVYNSFVL